MVSEHRWSEKAQHFIMSGAASDSVRWRLGVLRFHAPRGCLLSPAGFRYVTCQIHNCSDNTRTTPFVGPIDRGSLTVQDDYVFVKVRLLPGLLEMGRR